MTRFMSSTFALARPKVPSYRRSAVIQPLDLSRDLYLLLGELAGTLVLAVAEEFDDAALIGSKAVAVRLEPPKPSKRNSCQTRENVPSNLLDKVTDESGALAEVALGAAHTRLADAGGGLLYSGEERT